MTNRSRRYFVKEAAGAAAACVIGQTRAEEVKGSFSFILVGDLHFDKLEHHDFNWLAEHHPGDLSQIKNYSDLTTKTMPGLFAALKAHIITL